MLCRLFAGLEVLILDPDICANRNFQVLMQLRWENCPSVLALPLGSGCTEFRKQFCWGGSGCAGNGSPVCSCAFVSNFLHGQASSCSRAAKELKLPSQPCCWKLLGPDSLSWSLPWNLGLAFPPNILSIVLQYLMQALAGVLHFIFCLKIPSQSTFMGYFGLYLYLILLLA